MPGEALLTREEVAARLGVSTKTLQRRCPPGFAWVKIGRRVLLPEARFPELLKALEWRSLTASAAMSGTAAARSASARKRSSFPSSAQAQVAELTQKLLGRRKKPASARTTLTALPGGRDASP